MSPLRTPDVEAAVQAVLRRGYGLSFQHARARIAPRAMWRDLTADAVLLSYPKCGRTWLRFLLGNALQARFGFEAEVGELMELEGLRKHGAPWIRVTHDGHPDHLTPGELSRWTLRYLRKPVVFLVRDPRDAVVSLYYQHRFRELRFEGSLREFVFSDRSGLRTLISFYNAWTHRRRWTSRFLLVRYEDLKSDPTPEARRILEFLGVPLSESALEQAIDSSSFERMKALEASGAAKNRLGGRDASSSKVRKGRVGGYREALTPEDVQEADAIVRSELDPVYAYD
ncbi:MAG: sulfotransferase domain-containing protein [Myxococcota bacterium]